MQPTPANEAQDKQRDYAELIRRVRAGDEAATTELINKHQNALLIWARNRLHHSPHLRPMLDATGVVQSVLKSLVLGARAGEFQLDNEQNVLALLMRMLQHKWIDAVRRCQRRIMGVDGADPNQQAGTGLTPDEQLEQADAVAAVLERIPPEERQAVQERLEGREWTDIAAKRGEKPDAVRKRVERAVEQASQELGLRDDS